MNLLHPNSASTSPTVFSMSIRTSAFATVTLLRSLTLSLSHCHSHFRCHNRVIRTLCIPTYSVKARRQLPGVPAFASSSFVEQLLDGRESPSESEEQLCSPYSIGAEGFQFENGSADLKHLGAPTLEVKELDELPEQWRRSKLAWLCKECPAHKPGTLIRLLNAQKKWVRQDDAAYLTVHCLRIRENETAFRVSNFSCFIYSIVFHYNTSKILVRTIATCCGIMVYCCVGL